MDEQELKSAIAANIAAYRKLNNMTQAELAERLNYSDKSVSKWERGDGLPDVAVLSRMANIFGVTVNDLLSSTEKPKKKKRARLKDKILIPAMAICLVWLVAVLVFSVLSIIFPDTPRLWLAFIYAIPVSAAVAVLLLSLWGEFWGSFVFITIFIWSAVLSLYLTAPLRNMELTFIVAAALNVLVLLWFIFRYKPRKKSTKT